jgi:predicted dithiol-disulfide oxidoreductase (DUF899 family)
LELPVGSSLGTDFNFDFSVSFTEEQQREGTEYNFRAVDMSPVMDADSGPVVEAAAACGTNPAEYTREAPGMSAFALSDGVVYHTYSAYARGLDGMWGLYQWLDRAPKGRNEGRPAGVLDAPPRRVLTRSATLPVASTDRRAVRCSPRPFTAVTATRSSRSRSPSCSRS